MSDPINLKANLLAHPLVLLLRLVLMMPLIGIWLFDPIGIQTWTTIFGTSRANGLLTLSLLGEVGAILAAFAVFAQPRRPLYLAVNVAILAVSVASYFLGCFVGLWMGMEPGAAMGLTVTILLVAAVARLALRKRLGR